jgi:NADH:ubiquinone oxidoreductase subunit K
MDELDLLKKDWNSQQGNYPKLSYDQIYKMIWKRSNSIVKWIFYISLIELLAATILNIVFSGEKYWQDIEKYNLELTITILYVISYAITFYFIFRFYKNYKRISTTDDASKLMKNILRTRRTVKYYIAYVLISTGITVVGISGYMILNHSNAKAENISKYSFEAMDWVKFIGASAIVLTVFLGLIWLFYRLLYGILLKRLKKNYVELKKLEM